MILVTGANGLVGSFLCKALKRKNIAFKGLVRHDSDLLLTEELSDHLIHGDFLDIEFLSKELKNFTIIIHCAALVSFSKKREEEMFQVNVVGTKQLVDLALAGKIDYFIHLSSIAAIGRDQRSELVNETQDWISSKTNTFYAESKHAAELEVWRGIQEGLPACIINPSVILAPGDWTKSSTQLFKYTWEEHKYYGGGNINYVDVRDVTSACLALLEKRVTNERFILNGGSITYELFFQKVAAAFGKKPPRKKATHWESKLALLFFKLKSMLTNSEPMVTAASIRVANDTTVFDNSKAENLLNMEFTNLEDTISWTVESLKKRIKNN